MSRFKFNGDKIVLQFDFDQEQVLFAKSFDGRRYDSDTKSWSIPNTPDNIERLLASKYDWKAPEGFKPPKAQTATPKNIDDKLAKLGGTLREFQKAGVRYLVEKKRAFLADEMGLGKTVQALAACEVADGYPAVIAVPASLARNWKREGEKWLKDRKVVILDPKDPSANKNVDVVIVSYNNLKHATQLPVKTFIADESHWLKNHTSKRAELAKEIADKAQNRYLLSGTPNTGRNKDVMQQLIIMDKIGEFGGFWDFVKRYCAAKKTKYGWNFSENSNSAELRESLAQRVMLRRKKEDVLKDLPPKQRTETPVEISNRRVYAAAEKDFVAARKAQAREEFLFEVRIKNLKGEEKKEARSQYASASSGRTEADTLVQLQKLRGLVAEGKVKACEAWLDDFFEESGDEGARRKLVVFTQHKSMLEAMSTHLKQNGINCVKFSGDLSGDEKQAAVDRFQTDDKCSVFVSTMQSGGIGITLTAASDVLFTELDWSAATHEQAEDRCHRIGQTDSVNVNYLQADGTIDDMLASVIARKREAMNLDIDSEIQAAAIDKYLARFGADKASLVAELEKETGFSLTGKDESPDALMDAVLGELNAAPKVTKKIDFAKGRVDVPSVVNLSVNIATGTCPKCGLSMDRAAGWCSRKGCDPSGKITQGRVA